MAILNEIYNIFFVQFKLISTDVNFCYSVNYYLRTCGCIGLNYLHEFSIIY